jgi:hypothetical protein
MNKSVEINKYSNPLKVRKNLNKYLGKEVELYLSSNPKKKYMIKNPQGRWVHFGAFGMEDYTKHQDINRKNKYLARATNIRGEWKENPYSPNNLSLSLLWNYGID